VSDEEGRRLRDRVEAAEAELMRLRDQLVTAQARCVTLQEEIDFLRFSLEGGESKGLIAALAESREECERLKKVLAAPPVAPRTPIPNGGRVVLVSVAHEYYGFAVGPDRRTRDVIRTGNVDEARRAVNDVARLMGVQVEDLT
jgi:hypothetical protein